VANEFSKEERERNRRDLERISKDRRTSRKEVSLNSDAARQAVRDAAGSSHDPKSKAFKDQLESLTRRSKHLSDAEWQKEMDRVVRQRTKGGLFSSVVPLTKEEQARVAAARKRQQAKGGGNGCIVTAVVSLGILGAATYPVLSAVFGA
jgi:hypothetical protein